MRFLARAQKRRMPSSVDRSFPAAPAASRQLRRATATPGVGFDFGRISVESRETKLRETGKETPRKEEPKPIEGKKPAEGK